jgi:iron complex outermembrane receptor protein
MRLLLIILCILTISFNHGEGEEQKKLFVLKGTVVDKENKKPLAGASVRLEGTAVGGITNNKGQFVLTKIDKGEYSLLVTIIGYSAKKQKVKFTGDADTLTVNMEMEVNPFRTSEVVVSVNKQVQAVQDVPISISVIDKQKLSDRNIIQFDEALKYVPGLQVSNENISIRGSSGFAFGLGSRVALLINGSPMLSGDNGDIKFDIFPANEIKRIEIIKGAGSALYGTGAIGGVVNIIPQEPSKEGRFYIKGWSGLYTLPTYEQWRYRETLPYRSGAAASYSQSFGNFGGLVSGQFFRNEGYHDYGDETRYNVFGNFKYKFNGKGSVSLLTNYASDNSTDWVYWQSLDSATRPPVETDKSIRIFSDKLMLASEGKYITSSKFFSIFRLNYLRTSFANSYDENNNDYRQSVANSLFSEVQLNSSIGVFTTLTYGLTYNWNTVRSVTYGNQEQTISAFYAQVELKHIKNLIITVGLRFDNERTVGSQSNQMISPKLGLNYSLGSSTKLRLSAGKGFRAPTVAEKFASIKFQGFEVVPNLDLRPELSWSTEVGITSDIDLKSLALHLDGAVFYNYMNDLIEPAFDLEIPDAPIKFQNITKARIYGVEFTVKSLLFGYLGLSSSITLMNPEDLTLNETLKYRSKILWYNNLSIPLTKYLDLQADYRYMSKVVNVDPALALQINDYDARVPVHLLDVRLLLNLDTLVDLPLRLGLNAKNLLNYYYTEIPGNLGATRLLTLQFEGWF